MKIATSRARDVSVDRVAQSAHSIDLRVAGALYPADAVRSIGKMQCYASYNSKCVHALIGRGEYEVC